ncbi:SDR family oxidoreductase [Rhodovastum atsumiense]|nr:SDR family oxidoreductase [Rhodovastum atsumiense]CAH2601445.1 SDR family oxidoreductase [Rhodovastum atsumiense]
MAFESLRDAHAVVVGGSSGIGLAVAGAFVRAGARVDALARDGDKLAAALQPLGRAASGHVVDATDEAALGACFERIGRFDHLVIAASGGAADGMFASLTEERFRAAFEQKFWVHVRCLRLAVGRVRHSATFVTGAAGRRAMQGLSGLAATNGALHAMVGPLALELAPLRVNAVSPGLVDTPYWDKLSPEKRDTLMRSAAERLPARRVGTVTDLAEAILLVASNGFITGTILDCDGGARHI